MTVHAKRFRTDVVCITILKLLLIGGLKHNSTSLLCMCFGFCLLIRNELLCCSLPPYFSEYVETEDEDIFVITEIPELNVSLSGISTQCCGKIALVTWTLHAEFQNWRVCLSISFSLFAFGKLIFQLDYLLGFMLFANANLFRFERDKGEGG